MMIAGLQIIESRLMVEAAEDWSEVRSPARAKRRRWKHPQRIRFYSKPRKDFLKMGNTIVCHPDTARALLHELASVVRPAPINPYTNPFQMRP